MISYMRTSPFLGKNLEQKKKSVGSSEVPWVLFCCFHTSFSSFIFSKLTATYFFSMGPSGYQVNLLEIVVSCSTKLVLTIKPTD